MFGLIYRAQDWDQQRALLKAVMNIMTINYEEIFDLSLSQNLLDRGGYLTQVYI